MYMQLLILVVVLVVLYMCMTSEKYYNYSELDTPYRSTHPNRGRVSGVFTYSSPESWPMNNYEKTAAINVAGITRSRSGPYVEEKSCPNYY